jgi:hypothetical protein
MVSTKYEAKLIPEDWEVEREEQNEKEVKNCKAGRSTHLEKCEMAYCTESH